MVSLAESYTQEILHELKRFATWEPGLPLRLGDYGLLNGSLFSRKGNLADLGVTFRRRNDPAAKRVFYTSRESEQVEVGAGAAADVGPLANAKAALKISFGRENAILFNAAGVAYESVEDGLDLQRKLLSLLQPGPWDPRWSVVTELMHSGSTTVVVSSGSNAAFVLEAEADVPKVDLADVTARLVIKSERNIGFGVATADGMTPLFGLSRIRPRGAFWWRRTELRQELGFAGQADAPDTGTAPPRFQATLERNLDALTDAVRGEGTPAAEAFEWKELQPPRRPTDE
jgi:hypothetical protein